MNRRGQPVNYGCKNLGLVHDNFSSFNSTSFYTFGTLKLRHIYNFMQFLGLEVEVTLVPSFLFAKSRIINFEAVLVLKVS